MPYIVALEPKPICQDCGRNAKIRPMVQGQPALCHSCLPYGKTSEQYPIRPEFARFA